MTRPEIYYGEMTNDYVLVNTSEDEFEMCIRDRAYADDGVLSSRVTKGKFIEEANMKEPLQPLFFVCSKQDGELLTTQSLKYCNKVLQKEVCGLEHFQDVYKRQVTISTPCCSPASWGCRRITFKA